MSPCSASPHTWRQHGFPDSQLQRQVPQWSWVQGANLPWPAHSLKGWTLSEHQNAKDLAKSAVSMWEVKFSPRAWQRHDLFFQSFQYRKGIGVAPQRRATAATVLQQRWVTARTARYSAEPQWGLSVHHGSASLTLQTLMIRSSQPSKCRWREEQSAEHQRTGYPRAHSGQVLGEDPCPHLQHNTHGPKHTAGCVTVENSHRTPGTWWFLHKTLCILHCLLENKLETSSNITWATR